MKKKFLIVLGHKSCQFSLRSLILSGLLNTAPHALASTTGIKVVYGEDNRSEFHESSDKFQKLAKSTAVQIDKNSMTIKTSDQGEISYDLNATSLKDSFLNVCEDQRFANQMSAGNCSGFLVGPNLLVTAGHCIKSQSDCDRFNWVFDYKVDKVTDDAPTNYSKNLVYNCSKVINQKFERFGGTKDHVLIQLDRVVSDRDALTVRSSGKIEEQTNIVVMGYPSGLPLKISDGAQVLNNNDEIFFNSNLDTFGGNSGSAVFDVETGIVEGILVRGETDYIFDYEKGCHVVNYCKDDDCRGEDVTRITQIYELVERENYFKAIAEDDEVALSTILKAGFNTEMPDADLKTGLMKAVEGQNRDVTAALLNAGARATAFNENKISALSIAMDKMDQAGLEQILSLSKFRVVKIGERGILDFATDPATGDLGTMVLASLINVKQINKSVMFKVTAKLMKNMQEIAALKERGVDFFKDGVGQSLVVDGIDLFNGKPTQLKRFAGLVSANLNATNSYGFGPHIQNLTMLQKAFSDKNYSLSESLVLAGAQYNEIKVDDELIAHKAFELNQISLLDAMVTYNLDGNQKNKSGESLLSAFISKGENTAKMQEMSARLINLGASFANVKVDGDPLSHIAIKKGQYSVISAMLSAGLMGDEVNSYGENLAMVLVREGITTELFLNVLAVTTDMKAMNYRGQTLTDLAKFLGNKTAVKIVRKERVNRLLERMNPFNKG